MSNVLASSVPEACRRIGIGRTMFYELVKHGDVRVIRIGSRTLVPESELQKLVASRLGEPNRAA
jgi:excisionase family DNA binding protein